MNIHSGLKVLWNTFLIKKSSVVFQCFSAREQVLCTLTMLTSAMTLPACEHISTQEHGNKIAHLHLFVQFFRSTNLKLKVNLSDRAS